MMEKNDMQLKAMSDVAIVKTINNFIKHHRLEQNKSQSQLAEEAGINRSTLIEIEKGKPSNIITLIQLLRALNILYVLEQFQIQQQISPIQLAKLEQGKRKRASKNNNADKRTNSDW